MCYLSWVFQKIGLAVSWFHTLFTRQPVQGSLVQLSQYLAEMFVPLGNDCCACQGYSEQWQHHSNTWTARKVWSQAINYTVRLFCSVKRIIICEETAILCIYKWLEGKDTPIKEGNTNRLRKGCPLFCRKHTKNFRREKRRHQSWVRLCKPFEGCQL